MKRAKQETLTATIERLLAEADDFLSTQELVDAAHRPRGDVVRTLLYLRQHKAVDVVIQSGVGHWLSTPATDDRSRRVEERAGETRPRRIRRPHGNPRGNPSGRRKIY